MCLDQLTRLIQMIVNNVIKVNFKIKLDKLLARYVLQVNIVIHH